MAHGDITHVEIPVRDVASATAFFGELFGWQIAEDPAYPGYPMWQAPNGVSGGALVPRDSENEQPVAYVEVDSIESVLAAATARGGRVVKERSPVDDRSWWAVLADPDGNLIGLFESA